VLTGEDIGEGGRDARFANESDGDYYTRIANNVIHAVKEDKEHWFGVDSEGHGMLNKTGLASFLLEKLAPAVPLPAERIDLILRNILNAWSAWAKFQFKRDLADEVAYAINIPVPRTA
jgi:hypothetical protein